MIAAKLIGSLCGLLVAVAIVALAPITTGSVWLTFMYGAGIGYTCANVGGMIGWLVGGAWGRTR